MSDIADSATASITIADFANTDAQGKLNIIGAGVSMTALTPQSGQTAPLCVVVLTQVSPEFAGQEYTLELGLYSQADGQLVMQPAPQIGQPIRVAQVARVEEPGPPQGFYIPRRSIWAGSQIIVNFQTGLPLAAGGAYEFRASIDGTVMAVQRLAVIGSPPVTIG